MSRGLQIGLLATIMLVAGRCAAYPLRSSNPRIQDSAVQSATDANTQAETELQLGIALTQRGSFGEAIPHFLAAKGRVSDEYAVEFNLALCYTGTGQFEESHSSLDGIARWST